jgi:hypothetical protein
MSAAAVVALLALGCKKDPDPSHFKLGDIHSDEQLGDTLRRRIPIGTREAEVWAMMQGNGFTCREYGGILVDPKSGTLGSGKPDLNCSRETRINFGLKRRVWTVRFKLDSARVTDIIAHSMRQDL